MCNRLTVKARILYVIGTLGRGGAERQLCYLLSRMDRASYQPAVVNLNGSEQDPYVSVLRSLGVPVIIGPTSSTRIGRLRTLVRVARQLRPELIHSYSFYCNATAATAARIVGARCVGSLRSEFARQQRRSPTFWRFNAAYPRWQIWINPRSMDQARDAWHGCLRPELILVRPGIDLDAWPVTPLPIRDAPMIVAVGSLLPVKRWDRLLSAASSLAAAGMHFRVQIAGGGPLRARLEQQARGLNIDRQVEFLGDVDRIDELLSEASLLVHTAESEGGPNVVMEAMACARAVVTTDVGDVRSLVRNGISGIIIPNSDGPELAETLAALIAHPERLTEMGQTGRRDAETSLGLDRLVTETLDVYRRAGWIA